jgi:hypothetical protein
MQAALRSISAAGFLVFLAVAIASFLGPRFFERQAKQYLAERLRAEVSRKYPSLAGGGALEGVTDHLRARAGEARELLQSGYPDAIGALVSSLCKHDCGHGSRWAALVRDLLQEHVKRLEAGLDRVKEWAQGRFDELIDRILRDVRIFALTNSLMFALAFLAASVERPSRALLVIAGALSIGAAAGTGLYLFAQDWLHIILFADYVGWIYVVWVALIVAAELDLLLNRGRVVGGLLGGVAFASLE